MIRRIFSSIIITIVREIGMILLTLFVLIILYGIVINILNWALQYPWLFPFVTIPFIGLLVFVGLQDLKAPGLPIRKALNVFLLTVLIATVGFGALSLWLATVGWAKYTPENLDLFSYNNYYFWQFLDLIPLLKVNETLGLVAPLQPVGFVAGLPVLMFRIVVLFGLLKSLKEYWSRRKEQVENRVRSQGAM